MKITVIGAGRWGTCIAWYLATIGHSVTLYGRESSASFKELSLTHKNELITLPDYVKFTTDMSYITECEAVVVSVPTQSLQGLMDEIKTLGVKNKYFVLCMKGIEITTQRRLSQIAKDNLDESNSVSVWLGPGHVQDFVAGRKSCMVIDSDDENAKRRLVDDFSSPLIRFYYGTDLIGNEIGAATKNVIGIAAGMLDGLGLSSMKGPLIARAPREIARLIKVLGGKELSAYGLCHLGDYEATVFSAYSHNRSFGEAFSKGESYDKLAEGYYTAKAVKNIAERYDVDLPICTAVYNALYNGEEPKKCIEELFARTLKQEF